MLIIGEQPLWGDFTIKQQVRRFHVAESGSLSYGLVFRLGLLSTASLDSAVTSGYPVASFSTERGLAPPK